MSRLARSLAQADFQKAQSFAHHQPALEPWREKTHHQLIQIQIEAEDWRAGFLAAGLARFILEPGEVAR